MWIGAWMGEGIKRTSMVARASSLQSLKDSAAGWILLAEVLRADRCVS
jgi:hypothetical protein